VTEHASGEITIAKPISSVLEILLELDEYPRWIGEITSVEVHSRDERGRAIKATLNSNAMGKTITHTYEYFYDKYPNEIRWTFVEGNMVHSLEGKYKLDEVDSETKVEYDLEIELSSPLPGFIKKKAAQKIVDTALGDLKKFAEINEG